MLGVIRKMFELVAGLIAKEPGGDVKAEQVKRDARKALFWLIVTELLEIVQMYPLKYFIDGIIDGKSLGYLLSIVGIMLAIDVVVRIVAGVMNYARHVAAWHQYVMLLGFGHAKQMSMDVAWHLEHGTGEKESLIAKNLGLIDNLTDRVIYNGLPVAIRIVLTIVALLIIEPIFAVFGVVIICLFVAIMAYNGRYIQPLDKAGHKAWKDMHTHGTELSAKARTFKQFGVEKIFAKRYQEELDNYAEADIRRYIDWSRFQRRPEYILMAGFLCMYALFAWLHGGGREAAVVGTVVVVIEWLKRIFVNLYQFRDVQRAISEGDEALNEFIGLFKTVPQVRQAEHPQKPEKVEGRIELRDMGFTHPGNCTPTLHGINLAIEPNTTIALVGPSGAGKSTVAALLAREADPTEGGIFFDGINLRQFDYDYLRQQMVGIVSQDVQLIDGSIADNIRMGNVHATDEAVRSVVKKAHADEFINRLPDGYDSQVGENGVRLSGGQKQRVAIARALLRNPKLLILDEATSALDARSQDFVKATVDAMIHAREATIVVIAHRLSTVQSADVVYYMEDGRIVEFGSHQELLAQGGRYAEMVAREIGEHLD
jgi:ABC-type multidrug transport system fused ATPase/permease subunit